MVLARVVGFMFDNPREWKGGRLRANSETVLVTSKVHHKVSICYGQSKARDSPRAVPRLRHHLTSVKKEG